MVGSSSYGDIAIDDVFIDTTSQCRSPASCSFEDSLCLWTQVPTNQFNLLRITPQQLASVYPSTTTDLITADTSLNTKYGHFLWMNPSYNNIGPDKTSSLMSETIFAKNYPNGSCFSLMYLLNGGTNPGKINVYRKMYPSLSKTLEFTLSGNRGDKWIKALIPFKETGINYEIYIDVVLGSTSGNIAIDDLFLYDKNCSQVSTLPDKFNCGDGTTINYDKVCNFISDCANGQDERVCADCSFENSTCKYSDVSFGGIQWNRLQAQAAINGPRIDNTLKSPLGHFMLIERDDSQNVFYDVASLRLNQMLQPCSSTCELEFYYHMFGESDDLKIYLLENYFYTLLEEFEGDFGDKWNYARIPIGRIGRPFQFEFDGIRYYNGGDYDLAIDDIKLINCEFPVPRPNGCPSNYFRCGRESCISMNKVCDLIDDCGDNTDELNCANYKQCDFENGLCDWQNDIFNNNDLKWLLKKELLLLREQAQVAITQQAQLRVNISIWKHLIKN